LPVCDLTSAMEMAHWRLYPELALAFPRVFPSRDPLRRRGFATPCPKRYPRRARSPRWCRRRLCGATFGRETGTRAQVGAGLRAFPRTSGFGGDIVGATRVASSSAFSERYTRSNIISPNLLLSLALCFFLHITTSSCVLSSSVFIQAHPQAIHTSTAAMASPRKSPS
jgi:hypothetical protein